MNEHTLNSTTTVAGPRAQEAPVTAQASAWARWWARAEARLNVVMAGVLLLLALGFMLPGLPPFRIAAPMPQTLIYPPWQVHYPEAAPHYGGGDLLWMQLPWHQWLQNEYAAGRFPNWASGPVGGMSMLGSYEVGAFYPLHLLWALLPTGPAVGPIMALKLWLVGLGMWGFLRALRLHPAAAALGAIGLMFSGWVIDLLPWQLTSLYLLLPWLAWAIYAWCQTRSRWALVGVSAGVACAIFAGHPEMLFIVGLTLVWWTLGLVATSPWRQWARLAGGLALAVGLGFAIGAFQLWAFLETKDMSSIGATRGADTGLAGAFLRQDIQLYWILPRHWGFPPDAISARRTFVDGNAYVGQVALLGMVLALVALVRRQLRGRVPGIWALIALFAWLVCYDGQVGTFIRSFPPLNQSDNARWLSILAFAFLVMGAYGWDWFARWATARAQGNGITLRASRVWTGIGLILLAAGGVVLALHGFNIIPQPVITERINGTLWWVNEDYQRYWALWAGGVALALLGAAALWAAAGRTLRLAPMLLAAILVLDLWRVFQLINSTAPAEDYYPPTQFVAQVQQAMPPTERLVAEGEVLPPNTSLFFGIRDWRAADPMYSLRAAQAAQFLSPDYTKNPWWSYNMFLPKLQLPVAPLLGIRYFVFPATTDPNHPEQADPGRPNFKRLALTDGLGLWEAEGVPGFAYLSDRVQAVDGEPAAAAWMRNLTWDQARRYPALVEAPAAAVASIQPDSAGSSPGNVAVPEYAPGYIRLQANAARPALLAVAESLAPGWHATLDGQPVDILRTNYLSQGVVVPAGRHTVEFRYQPVWLAVGGPVSLLGLVGLVGLAGGPVWWRRRRQQAQAARSAV